MARRRGERIQVYVEMPGGLKYGFQGQEYIYNTYGKILGQTAYQGAQGVFFGANSPKPYRATKDDGAGTNVSSFCSSGVLKELRAAGWKVGRKSTRRGIRTSGKTKTVVVDMPGGYKYAWNITSAEYAEATGILGAEVPGAADIEKMVWGSTPKPPRASKVTEAGSTSTFMAPKQSVADAAAAAGWTVGSSTVGYI
ncbi:MAG: hypothetical protein ACRC2R_10830 [Xenococcaceae cyanobacterium]